MSRSPEDLRFSIRLNNDLPAARYPTLAQAAEEAGFDQIWVSDDLFLRSAPVLVHEMLRATTRLQVGVGILNPYTIHPSEIAMLAATLDEVSACRFNLGLAAGAEDFLSWVGIDQTSPLGTVREAVATVRALLAGEEAPSGSRFAATEAAYLRFEAPRTTPIYLGAMGPRMIELAGEIADGALPLLFPPEHFHEVRDLLEGGLARRSADLGPLDFAACVWVSVSDDAASARRVLAEKIAYYGHALSPLILARLGLARADFEPIRKRAHDQDDLDGAAAMVDDRMLRIGISGTAEDVLERLVPLVDAGARHLSFGPPLGPSPVEAIHALGRTVIVGLRESRR